jgi:hypothetical protein
VIRQAISCDICGTEMQHTNHWFVAYSHGAELRVSGWIAGKRLRSGAKHLCGQTCLHKLLDEFLARTASPSHPSAPTESTLSAQLAARKPQQSSTASSRTSIEPPTQQGLSSDVYIDEFESSARLVLTPDLLAPSRDAAVPDPPAYTTRNGHGEAWRRERERALRGETRSALLTAHHRNIA